MFSTIAGKLTEMAAEVSPEPAFEPEVLRSSTSVSNLGAPTNSDC